MAAGAGASGQQAAVHDYATVGPTRLLLYDGHCFFCDDKMQFLVRQKLPNDFHFGTLQSAEGEVVLSAFPHLRPLDTIVYVEKAPLDNTKKKPLWHMAGRLWENLTTNGWFKPAAAAAAKARAVVPLPFTVPPGNDTTKDRTAVSEAVPESTHTEITVSVKSQAAFRVGMATEGVILPLLATVCFYVVPAFIGDFCYDIVAKRRHRLTWFGGKPRAETCIMPTPAMRRRMWRRPKADET